MGLTAALVLAALHLPPSAVDVKGLPSLDDWKYIAKKAVPANQPSFDRKLWVSETFAKKGVILKVQLMRYADPAQARRRFELSVRAAATYTLDSAAVKKLGLRLFEFRTRPSGAPEDLSVCMEGVRNGVIYSVSMDRRYAPGDRALDKRPFIREMEELAPQLVAAVDKAQEAAASSL